MYDYRNSKANIINILKSKTKIERTTKIPNDKNFTYENGILTWVGAIFVDIKDSTELFSQKDEKLARLMRAFTSEIICIMQSKSETDSENKLVYNEIGIRGDCVYALYSAGEISHLVNIFHIAVEINTFLEMFNCIIKDYGYNTIVAGIGLGCDENLIIKAGRSGTGINDKIWIGNAVVDASNLSSIANRNGIKPIAMSKCFYNNIIANLEKENIEYKNWINPVSESHSMNAKYYACNIIKVEFNKWIEDGMK